MMKNMTKGLTLAALLFCMVALPALAQADALADVKAKGELSFALSGQYPPFSFINDKGELGGFDVEIGMEIARRIGVKGRAVQTAWDGILAGLLADKYDTIIGSMAITEERLKSVDFTDPYYRSGAQLFVKNKSGIDGLAGMEGKKVGVSLGETYETWMNENHPEIQLASYKGLPLIIADLMNGRIQGFITDKVAGTLTIKDKNLPAHASGDLLYPENIGIAIKKDKQPLLDAMNKALKEMKADGTYLKICKKWVGADIR